MHIRKYDFDYGRRKLLDNALRGVGGAGVLTALWPLLSRSMTLDATKAYPDELLSIEVHTKGKIKPGDVITKDNVEHVEHLLDPITAHQIKNDGRRAKIRETETDVSKLFHAPYLEATLRNEGKAVLDSAGNVRTKGTDGAPWLGGNPFPDPENGIQAAANMVLSWGRHNFTQYAVRDWDIGPDGSIQYHYNFGWAELQVTARNDDKIWRNQKDMLRYATLWFVAPREQAGTSFLQAISYDQREFGELVGYIPAFRRVREYPNNQRFEPVVPGSVLYLSDAWGAGDPYLTWGNYKIVDRKPMLGMLNGNWHGRNDRWEPPVHGGGQDQTYWDCEMELVPETLVLDSEPVKYSRSPVGKKRVWLDARNMMFVAYNTYDRKGELWKSQHVAFCQYKDGDKVVKDDEGNIEWGFSNVVFSDIQTGRVTRYYAADRIEGGETTRFTTEGENVYQKYMTRSALRTLV